MTRQTEDMIVPEGWGFVETIDRRDFLRLTSTGVLVMFAVRPPEGAMRPVWNFAEQQRTPPDFNAFLHIGANGRVTLFVGKIEMGQGIITGLPQIVAEQLNVPLDRVDCVMGDTDLCPFDNGTFGSLSVWRLGPTLHAAAAEARAVLVQMASEKLSVPVADLEVKDGVILAKGDLSKKVTYGELAGGKKIERRYEGQAALEKVSEYTIIGKSYPRRDAVEKVTGKAKYSGDIVPAGALHARVVRPPAHGATITAIDTSAAAVEMYPCQPLTPLSRNRSSWMSSRTACSFVTAVLAEAWRPEAIMPDVATAASSTHRRAKEAPMRAPSPRRARSFGMGFLCEGFGARAGRRAGRRSLRQTLLPSTGAASSGGIPGCCRTLRRSHPAYRRGGGR